jgi:hypothetical protein
VSAEALNACAAYWWGERTGPILSVVAEPTYRQTYEHQLYIKFSFYLREARCSFTALRRHL